MPNYSIDRRIRPPKKMRDVLNELVNDNAIFETYAEAMTFAAAVGFHFQKRKKLDGSGDGIHLNTFDKIRFFELVINTITFAETNDPDIFKRENIKDFAIIFEEYAYGGLKHLENVVCRAPGDNLQNIISLIQSLDEEETDSDDEVLLSTFSKGLFDC